MLTAFAISPTELVRSLVAEEGIRVREEKEAAAAAEEEEEEDARGLPRRRAPNDWPTWATERSTYR